MAKKKSESPRKSAAKKPAKSKEGKKQNDHKRSTGDKKRKSDGQQEMFPIIGIGASAGGLAALKEFFHDVPADSGLAFVVVVHLSPEHKSHLAELLQPHIKMPVEQVSKTVALEKNHVYVIPPNANLDTIDTHLRLTELEKRRQERAPVDHFFRTLAKTHDGDAIGIILTGTGSDGTLGLREIKQSGGLTIVQDPNEAEYDGMPQSAIAMGRVDLVLPLAQIPQAILRYTRTRPHLPVPKDEENVDREARRLLQKVFSQLRARTGRDFSRYKGSTILRRIQRRMQLRYLTELNEYLTILREQPDELRILADDLLITVTSFYRDPEVFEALEKDIIPKLFEGKGPEDEIRIWSVGCATGEEAYSLAMLILEEAARRQAPPQGQIFASDLHEHSLRRAREGFYPGDIETDVSAERLKQFFARENGGYRIHKNVREMVVFAPHNLLNDPPFSRLDLISCRNLLIYLQRDVQRDVIELFHYALRSDGTLVLGPAETLEETDLFRLEDKQRCIFQKRNVPGPEPRLPVFPLARARLPGDPEHSERPGEPLAYGMLHQRMVERYAPPSALLSPDDKLVHLSEHAGRYLVYPGGELTANIYKLIREELRIELRSALHTARERREPISTKPMAVRFNGETRPVVLHIRPALEPQEGFVLVIFDEREPDRHAQPQAAKRNEKQTPVVGSPLTTREDELEAELSLTQQRLQAIIEEYETSQEEMKASNEEMQSTNEELRSTMEELETSKEELQSMNEELQTVNQENRHKVEELAQLSGDLQNLMAATDIATLFLDRKLRILRFTPQVEDLFNVRMADRGRALSDLTHHLGYDELHRDAKTVLKKLVPIEREVQDEAGRWYLTRVLPYRSTEDRIDGVVITFVDITGRKETEVELRASEQRLQKMANIEGVGVLILDESGTLIDANDSILDTLGYSREDVNARRLSWRTFTPPEWRIVSEQQLQKLAETGRIGPYEKEYLHQDGTRSWMLLAGAGLGDGTVVKYCIDVSDRKQAEDDLRQSQQQLAVEVVAMQRLHQLVGRLLNCEKMDDALNEVLVAAIEITAADMGNIQIFDSQKSILRIVAQQGFGQEFLDHFREVSVDTGSTCSRALQRRQRVVVEDVQQDPSYEPHRDIVSLAGYRTVQSTPLMSREGELLGVLSTHYRQPQMPSQRDLRILDLYARQAADFIERVRYREAEKLESRRKDEFLATLAHEL